MSSLSCSQRRILHATRRRYPRRAPFNVGVSMISSRSLASSTPACQCSPAGSRFPSLAMHRDQGLDYARNDTGDPVALEARRSSGVSSGAIPSTSTVPHLHRSCSTTVYPHANEIMNVIEIPRSPVICGTAGKRISKKSGSCTEGRI